MQPSAIRETSSPVRPSLTYSMPVPLPVAWNGRCHPASGDGLARQGTRRGYAPGPPRVRRAAASAPPPAAMTAAIRPKVSSRPPPEPPVESGSVAALDVVVLAGVVLAAAVVVDEEVVVDEDAVVVGDVAAGRRTVNDSRPEIGCPSADPPRQITSYGPAGSGDANRFTSRVPERLASPSTVPSGPRTTTR